MKPPFLRFLAFQKTLLFLKLLYIKTSYWKLNSRPPLSLKNLLLCNQNIKYSGTHQIKYVSNGALNKNSQLIIFSMTYFKVFVEDHVIQFHKTFKPTKIFYLFLLLVNFGFLKRRLQSSSQLYGFHGFLGTHQSFNNWFLNP